MSASRSSTGMKRKSTSTIDDERQNSENDIAEGVLNIEKQLIRELTNSNITYEFPVEYVYNPLDYAFELHSKYVYKYCNSKKKILFLGMNPGPWGMVQCGVRFCSDLLGQVYSVMWTLCWSFLGVFHTPTHVLEVFFMSLWTWGLHFFVVLIWSWVL